MADRGDRQPLRSDGCSGRHRGPWSVRPAGDRRPRPARMVARSTAVVGRRAPHRRLDRPGLGRRADPPGRHPAVHPRAGSRRPRPGGLCGQHQRGRGSGLPTVARVLAPPTAYLGRARARRPRAPSAPVDRRRVGARSDELRGLLERVDLPLSGAKDVRIGQLWASRFSEATLLQAVKGDALGRICEENGVSRAGKKAERIERVVQHLRRTVQDPSSTA